MLSDWNCALIGGGVCVLFSVERFFSFSSPSSVAIEIPTHYTLHSNSVAEKVMRKPCKTFLSRTAISFIQKIKCQKHTSSLHTPVPLPWIYFWIIIISTGNFLPFCGCQLSLHRCGGHPVKKTLQRKLSIWSAKAWI